MRSNDPKCYLRSQLGRAQASSDPNHQPQLGLPPLAQHALTYLRGSQKPLAKDRGRANVFTGLLGGSSANVAVGVARWEYENKTKKHVLDCELWPRGELSKAGMEQWVSSPTLAGHNSVCGRLTVGEKKLSGLREAEDEKGLEHG